MKIINLSIVVTTLSLVFGSANGQLPACVYPPYSDLCASIPNPSLVVTCNCMPPSLQEQIAMFVAGFQPAADAMLPPSCYEEQYLQYLSDLISGLATETSSDVYHLSTRECPTFPSFVGSSAALTCPIVFYESPRVADTISGLCLTEECAIPDFMSIFVINLMDTVLSCRESCEGLPAEFGCTPEGFVPPGGCSSKPIAAPIFPSCSCVNDFWPEGGNPPLPGPCDTTCDSSSMFDISISNGVSFPYPHCTQGCESDEPGNVEALGQIWLNNKLFCPDEGDSITVTLSDKPFKGTKSCSDGNKRLCKAPKTSKAPKASKGKSGKSSKTSKGPKSPKTSKVSKSAETAKASKAAKM